MKEYLEIIAKLISELNAKDKDPGRFYALLLFLLAIFVIWRLIK